MNETRSKSKASGWLTPSAAALIGAKLMSLGDVLFLGWKALPLTLVSWIENVILKVHQWERKKTEEKPPSGAGQD
jgi:hypothetical protein